MNDIDNNFKIFSQKIFSFIEKKNSQNQDKKFERIEINFSDKVLGIYYKEKREIKKYKYTFTFSGKESLFNQIFRFEEILENIFEKETKPQNMFLEIRLKEQDLSFEIFENGSTKTKIDKEIKKNFDFYNLIMFSFLYYIKIDFLGTIIDVVGINFLKDLQDAKIEKIVGEIKNINKIKKENFEENLMKILNEYQKLENNKKSKISYILNFLKNKKKLIFTLLLIIFTFFFFLIKKYFK